MESISEDSVSLSPTLPTSQSLDNTLKDIRSGRRLNRIASSISSFLLHQMDRLEAELDRCQKAADNDQVVQRMLTAFEKEKLEWEAARAAEIERLNDATEKLASGWEKLESEKQQWLESRGRK